MQMWQGRQAYRLPPHGWVPLLLSLRPAAAEAGHGQRGDIKRYTKEREERERERKTDKDTDRKREIKRERETERERGREKETETDR